MSSRLFQGAIHQMHDATDRTIGITDETSVIIACSELGRIGEVNESIAPDTIASPNLFAVEGYAYKPFGNRPRPEYAVLVSGNDSETMKYVNLLSALLGSIKQYHDEKYGRSSFVRNVTLDNILSGDIYFKARELYFNSGVSRVCMLVKTSNKSDISACDVIQNLFFDKSKDFITNVSETDVALIEEIRTGIELKSLGKLASSTVNTFSNEFYTHCIMGIGTIAVGIKNLARSPEEAQVALEVDKVFDTEKSIVSYDNLGIARLIYQLPAALCEMFPKEVFKHGSTEPPDHETLFTIQRLFRSNLNVPETSRKLFVHCDALVYHLEETKKITRPDLCEFEDAIVFEVALMVRRYLPLSPVKF